MANISHFTQTVNGVSTTYDIHDANAVPRSGGAVLSGNGYYKATNDSYIIIGAGSNSGDGAAISLNGATRPWNKGQLILTPIMGILLKICAFSPMVLGLGTVQLAKLHQIKDSNSK